MPFQIDPEDGMVEFAIGGGEPVPVDSYHAVEVYTATMKAYFRELEAAGRQADADQNELLTRWAVKVFAPHPHLTPAGWSLGAKTAILTNLLGVVNAAKKPEPESSTPA